MVLKYIKYFDEGNNNIEIWNKLVINCLDLILQFNLIIKNNIRFFYNIVFDV